MNGLLAPARWRQTPLLLCLLGVVAATVLFALLPRPAAAEPLDDQVRQIAKQLRCPICESVSVADSPADLAVQMRSLIRKKLQEGESERQIIDYFVAAYGDSVLLEPPRRGLGWLVWLGPVLALAAGAVVLTLVLRVWVRRPSGVSAGLERAAPESDAGLEARTAQARDELEALRRGLAR